MSKLRITITEEKTVEATTDVVIELLDVRSVLAELERAFTHLDGIYYYNRKLKLSRREEELVAILERADIGYAKDAPVEQYLVITRR